MKLDNNQPTPQTESKNFIKGHSNLLKDRKLLILFVLLLIIAVATAGYWYLKVYKKSPVRTDLSNYSYDENLGPELLKTHILKGSTKNTAVSIDIPVNDVVYSDSPFDKVDARLERNSTIKAVEDEGDYLIMGQRIVTGVDGDAKMYFQTIISVKTVPKAEQPTFNVVEHFRRILANHSFNTSSTPSTAGFGFTQPQKFITENISEGGQIYTASAQLRDPNNQNPVKTMKGELIQVKGKNADYYILLSAADSIWDKSPETWKAIKNSIKVDQ